MTEFFNSSEPVARKEHKCECCGRMIKAGERYVRETGKVDGDFFSRAWHLDCKTVMRYYFEWLSIDPEWFDYDEAVLAVEDDLCYGCEKSHWKNDECEETVWTCPIIKEEIRKKYESKGVKCEADI